MQNTNRTDKRMNNHEPHRQTQTISMTIKRTDQLETYRQTRNITDKHMRVRQQQICTTQENV